MSPREGYPLDIWINNSKAIIFIKGKDSNRVEVVEKLFSPVIYFLPSDGNSLHYYWRALEEHPSIIDINIVEKRVDVRDNRPKKILRLKVLGVKGKEELIGLLSPRGQLFNIDLDHTQQFMLDNDFFPGLLRISDLRNVERREETEYYVPELSETWLEIETDNPDGLIRLENKLRSIHLMFDDEEIILEGEEEEILRGLSKEFLKKDPDIVYTNYGDNKLFPYLFYRAKKLEISNEIILGRSNHSLKKAYFGHGKSFVSYGMVYYKSFPYYLVGRVHVDVSNSFFFKDSGISGLHEISRLSSYTLQKVSRMSIGKAFTGVEIVTAFKNGILINSEKATPEKIKPASVLLKADSGGMIFTPTPGLYQGVIEVDFTSFYPFIMRNYNISSETVLCNCCNPRDNRVNIVPYVGYHICGKKKGIVPLALEELLRRRLLYKKLKRTLKDPSERKIVSQKDATIKWMLVTCFGYLGFRHARWGSIESHQAVTAYGRKILFETSRIFEKHGWETVAGIVDSLWIKRKNTDESVEELRREVNVEEELQKIISFIERKWNVPLELDGILEWIVFLPLKENAGIGALTRYYGKFESGTVKARGIELRRRDAPVFIKKFQEEVLNLLKNADSRKEFLALLPKTREILRCWREKIWRKRIPVKELIINKKISKTDYKVSNHQSIALRQFREKGIEIRPGEKISYLVVNNRSSNLWRKILISPLVTEETPYDVFFYDDYLVRSYDSMLGFLSEKILP